MKIILICSSLEPGRDGVGDYARRLGAALIKKNNGVALLALNDRHVTEIVEAYQLADDLQIPVLRLPSQSLQKNTPRVKAWINAFKPDWLSLQYVIFGYHPKGLPVGLSRQLLAIGGGLRWHIMFHELWLGMATEESAKLKLWGTVQRYLIKSLVNHLHPRVIHTQTKLYQQHLKKIGYPAACLPLFSNIPVKPGGGGNADAAICLIVFGLIHTGAAIEALADDAAQYSGKYGKEVKLVFAGHCGSEQDRWASLWQQKGLPVALLGEQPAGKISQLLQQATMGLSSTAMAVVEKSGAFAAMRGHGLPVINVSKPWTPRGIPAQGIPQGIVAYHPGSFEAILANREKYITTGTQPEATAQQMMDDLLTNASA